LVIYVADHLRRRLEPLLNFEQRSLATPFSVQEIINILREERAEDIVCIRVPVPGFADKNIVICTPHNTRHSEAMMLAIRKCFKLKTNCEVVPPRKSKVGRWLCYSFGNIVLHMMSRDARLKYDLESLWGVGWEEMPEDEFTIPTPPTSVSPW
uniref:Ribosomal silencing factor RsfS n=1 Tax=Gongylonema pulchrum TaxID=637853 RepID=A0A183DCA9_9BILA